MASYDGMGSDPTIGGQDIQSLDPVLTQATRGPSPADEQRAQAAQERGIRQRIAQAEAAGPTLRQRTQSETIDLLLLQNRLGNPFSTRWIPFEQLRDMTTDLMLAFGWWMTVGPIINSNFYFQGPDAQLNAAVDEAYRKIHVNLMLSLSNDLWYGHQPLVKQFELGRLGGTYRDPNGKNPENDLPVWSSSADALLWRAPLTLNPSHCLPMWDGNGQMIGFKFSNMPIPHFDLISAASTYGYMVIPGHEIDSNYAIWSANEQELEFGSCFGASRTKRAYPIWWSKWFRWHIADRSFENLADPPKYVYYPVDFDEFIDPDDPNQESPKVRQARQTAIDVGNQMRSGATIAFPGSFAESQDGRGSAQRKWEAGYFNAPNNFSDFDASIKILDLMLLRAWFAPEQAYVEGAGNRTSGGSAGGTGGSRMASQLADVHAESQGPLIGRYDEIVNRFLIPQFIAANFPEKAGTPCEKITRDMGQADDQTLSQVLQLIGQVRGEVIPVDIRALLEQMNIPLLNQKQMRAEIAEISKLAQIMGPPETPPTPRGTQGYNAGVMKTQAGTTLYYQPPERIVLSETGGFLNSLPDTPHFTDPTSRAQANKLYGILRRRYQEQMTAFSVFLEQQPTLHLAENGSQKSSGLDKTQASAAATAIVGAWAASQAPKVPGAAQNFVSDGLGAQLAEVLTKIAMAGGRSTLKSARLHAEDFDESTVSGWVTDECKALVDSIDQTVRDEAREWLIDELQSSVDPSVVAAAAKEHFAPLPDTHAARAGRTASAESFNRGVIEAATRAGISQLQIHDGTDHDSVCRERNGKVVSTEEARGVHLAHPNCVLSFRPLTTESLSVERVEALPAHLAADGKHVAYDEPTETLYLDGEIDELQEQAVLLMLGDQLSLV